MQEIIILCFYLILFLINSIGLKLKKKIIKSLRTHGRNRDVSL